MRSTRAAAAAAVLAVLFAGCGAHGTASGGTSSGSAGTAAPTEERALYDPRDLPAGEVGALIRYGHDVIMDTPRYAAKYVGARISCSACHVAGGLVPKGGNLAGIYGNFPQWSKRAHRVITLQDRIAECFLRSENGTPPPYTSRTMTAIVAYIAWISRKAPLWTKPDPALRIARFSPPAAPDPARGAVLYAQRCSVCHQANGAGVGTTYPPLWGPASFNDGAGMHKLVLMAGFVRYNMPANAPGTLTDQQAYDVAAYVLQHARPHFDPDRMIGFPPEPAGFF
jgi:thiosulfate dehydrogenase